MLLSLSVARQASGVVVAGQRSEAGWGRGGGQRVREKRCSQPCMSSPSSPTNVHPCCAAAAPPPLLLLLLLLCSCCCCRCCVQVGDDMRRSIPDNYYYLIAALEKLSSTKWPVVYHYDACPTCNKLYRCELKDATECSSCKDRHPDDPTKYTR